MSLMDVGTDRLLDRERELAAVADALDAVQWGAGTLLLVEGGAGIGKTRLLSSALELASLRGMRCLFARGGELERKLPFGVVRQLFEPLLAGNAAADRDGLLEGAAALAAAAVDPHADPSDAPATFATLHGLYWLTANAAARRPLTIAVDDGHWSDTASLRFLAYLARRLDGLRVLVVATVRTGDPHTDDILVTTAAEPRARVLTPQPLGEQAVAALLADGLGEQPDPALLRACHAATRGNPFLAHELVLALRERPAPPVAADVERLPLESVARSVLGRLARLHPDAGRLARSVAVLGEGATLPVAARLAALDPDQAAALADALVRADVLEHGARLRFAHPLVRSAVAGSVGPGELEAAHRRAAGMLAEAGEPADLVAAHLMSSQPAGERWAVETLVAAAERATARGAPDEAAAFLRRALAEPPEASARRALLLELGVAEVRASDPASIAHLEQVRDEAVTPLDRAHAALALGRACAAFGRFADAVRVYERGLAELGDADAELALELEAEMLGAAPLALSTRPLGLERVARVDPDLTPSSRAACKALANLAREEMARLGSRQRAIELAERSLSGGYLMADEPLLTFPYAPVVLALAGELDRAVQVYDEALARTRARGAVLSAALILALRGFAVHNRGQLAEAAADTRDALDAAETYGAPLIAGYAAGFLATTLVAQGELDEAEAALERVTDLAALPDAFSGVHVLRTRGRLRLEQNRPDEAAADLRECGRRLDAWEVRNPGLAPWRGDLALAEHRRGQIDVARALAAEQLALARRWDAPWVLAAALRIYGAIEGDADALREAAETAAAGGAQLERARSLVELGALLRRSGARREAREPLRTGLDLALACEARPLAERAHAELVASGGQPRRLRESGPDALTPAERRVAGMAVDGLTNRAIAQALFVSEKTVETHLSSVYRKLDVASRSQLPGALGRTD